MIIPTRIWGLLITFCAWDTLVVGQAAQNNTVLLEIDLGVIDEGTSTRHLVELKNSGTDHLHISSSKVSCDKCLTIVNSPKKVLPGSVSTIEFEYDATGKYGEDTQYIIVETAGGYPSAYVLQISLFVRAIWTQPTKLNYGTLQIGDNFSNVFHVLSTGTTRLTADDYQLPEGFSITIDPDVEVRGNSRSSDVIKNNFMCTLNWEPSESDVGPLSEIISINSGSFQITIPVEGYNTGIWKPTPSILNFGTVRLGTTKEVNFSLENNLVGLETNPAQSLFTWKNSEPSVDIQARINQFHQSGRLEFTASLSIPEDTQKGLLKGDLIGKHQSSLFSIPYTVFILAL